MPLWSSPFEFWCVLKCNMMMSSILNISVLLNFISPQFFLARGEAFLDLIFQILCCSNPLFEFQKVYFFMILVWAGSPYISQLPTSHLECSSWDAKSCGFGSPMTTNPHLARHAWERLPKYSSDMSKNMVSSKESC